MFEIDNTPYPERRVIASKYDETFAKMRPGQCIKLETKRAGSVANALRTWLSKNGKTTDLKVSLVSKMPDGYGRVYLLPKHPMKMADVPARKISKLSD